MKLQTRELLTIDNYGKNLIIEVIVLEDAVVGIVAAKKAGCKVFAIQTYFGEKQLEDADKIFPNHLGILNFIKKNFKSIFG